MLQEGSNLRLWFIRPTLEQDVAEVENAIEESEEKEDREKEPERKTVGTTPSSEPRNKMNSLFLN